MSNLYDFRCLVCLDYFQLRGASHFDAGIALETLTECPAGHHPLTNPRRMVASIIEDEKRKAIYTFALELLGALEVPEILRLSDLHDQPEADVSSSGDLRTLPSKFSHPPVGDDYSFSYKLDTLHAILEDLIEGKKSILPL